MKTVEILLRDHVENLGRCGDVVTVAAGYARNYLLPHRIAVPANEDNKRQMERRRAKLDLEEAARTKEIDAKVAALSACRLTTSEKADENGHLYGSVSATTVASLLTKAGYPIEERHIRLDLAIKTTGEHIVKVHVHGEHHADVTVEVTATEAT
jgi:large subunit ribosomal protein L9